MSQGKTTTDHKTIRTWAEKRGGHPARVRGTGNGDDPGLLCLDFGAPDEKLDHISWDEFFEKFEENKLALLFQDEDESHFNKLIRRH